MGAERKRAAALPDLAAPASRNTLITLAYQSVACEFAQVAAAIAGLGRDLRRAVGSANPVAAVNFKEFRPTRRKAATRQGVNVMRAMFLRATFGAVMLLGPSAALAGEQVLEFKLVTKDTDMKVIQVANVEGRAIGAGNLFGVAFFKDGRVAAKDFVGGFDTVKGQGKYWGYSTYTFEDGSSITASYVAESKATGFHGDYTILSGTGLYDKATGTGTFDARPTKWKDGANLFDGKFDIKTP
jgi:hypothetical protein